MAGEIFDRRDFLLTLAAGSAVVIAGAFVGKCLMSDEGETDDKPQMRDCIRQSAEGQLMLKNDHATCTVNKTGEYIVGLLDGTKTLPDICERVAQHYSLPHSGELEASVAMFICRLGMAGFLISPYSVFIYEA
jgi:hypothetical protein